MRYRASITRWLREPSAINAAQILQYTVAVFAGTMAAFGVSSPVFMTNTIGPKLILAVGIVLAVGGLTGATAVITGMWWLERIALFIVGTGWIMLLPAAVFFAATGSNSAIWLVMVLVVWALCDVFKRYRRIDWAYLDPSN
jgi:hypothetical protein